MILRGRHRRRQMAEAEFFEAGQEAFLLLAAKHPEHEFGGVSRAAPRHHGQDEAGEKGMIEIGDAAPALPLRLLCSRLVAPLMVAPESRLLLAGEHYISRHCEPPRSRQCAPDDGSREAIHPRDALRVRKAWIASSLALLAMTA